MEHIDQLNKLFEMAAINADITRVDSVYDEIYQVNSMVDITFFPQSNTWEVGTWDYVPGGRWAQDDVDYVKIYETTNIIDAVKYAITALVDLLLNDAGEVIFPEADLLQELDT